MDITLLEDIIDELKNLISKEDFDTATEYLAHDEWGLAFEYICELLFRYQIPISYDRLNQLEKLGKMMEIEDAYWLPLQKLIIQE